MLVTLDVLPVKGSSVQATAGAGQPSTRVSTREGNRARCAECGVVESILEMGDGRYRMTVRLRDGTMATSDELTPRSWRAGQRVIVVQATDPRPR